MGGSSDSISGLSLLGAAGGIFGNAANTYSTVKAAKSNANLADAQADYIERVTAANVALVRKKSAYDMRMLASSQEQEYAQNRVNAAVSGNMGASAYSFFSGSLIGYAQQRNQLVISQNTALLKLVTDGSLQAQTLRAQAGVYNEKASSALMSGMMSTFSSLGNSWIGQNALVSVPDSGDTLLGGGGGSGDDIKKTDVSFSKGPSAAGLNFSSQPWYTSPTFK
jgi:hypothetical protein